MGNRASNNRIDNGESETLAPQTNRPGATSNNNGRHAAAIEAVTPFTPPSWPHGNKDNSTSIAAAPASGSLAAQLNNTTFAGLSRSTPPVISSGPATTIAIRAASPLPSSSGKVTPTTNGSDMPQPGTVARLKRLFSRDTSDASTTPAASPSSSWLPMPFASSSESEPPSCVSSLSRRQRLTGFIFCFALGCICSLLSSMYVPLIVVRPAKFAFPYTCNIITHVLLHYGCVIMTWSFMMIIVGNLLSIGSTAFLIGPVAQVKSMFAPVRALSSVIYILSMFLTLYCALGLRMFFLLLVSLYVGWMRSTDSSSIMMVRFIILLCIIMVGVQYATAASSPPPPSSSGPSVSQLIARGEALLNKGELPQAITIFDQCLTLMAAHDTDRAQVLAALGQAHAMMRRFPTAIKYLQDAIMFVKSLTPIPAAELARSYYNLGYTYEQSGRSDALPLAAAAYEQSVAADATFVEGWVNAAQLANQQGQRDKTITFLQRAIALQPKRAKLYLHLADTLNNMKRWPEAVEVYKKGLEIDPTNHRFHLHIADTLTNIRELDDAIIHYERALTLAPATDRGEPVVGLWHVKTELADWSNWQPLLTSMRTSITSSLQRGAPSPLSPYQSLFLPLSQQQQLAIAESWASRNIHEARQATGWKKAIYKQVREDEAAAMAGGVAVRPLRIGYISRRFEEYAGTQLMLRIFGLHNRDRVTIICYAHGPDDASMERATVKRDCDRFDDVSLMTPINVARLMVKDAIDIIVDYDGAHNFNSLAVLALRPAPIQITYLGFAGTGGARGVVDYIITDRFITPPETQQYYAEKFLYLPDTYQPQDHLQEISSTIATRASVGLPSTGFVFVCFNRIDKIEPDIFGAWMTILQRVSHSVLWLFNSHATAVSHLISEATAAGVDASRLVFAPRLPKPQHMARHTVADLFLDTLHYNAHTTATDAMFMGVPVLTLPGSTFASRVGGSLVTAAGGTLATNFIASSLEDYIERAVRLATDEQHIIAAARDHLLNHRDTFALFNTPLYVNHMEDAYHHVWQQWVNGVYPVPSSTKAKATKSAKASSGASATSASAKTEL